MVFLVQLTDYWEESEHSIRLHICKEAQQSIHCRKLAPDQYD